MILVDARGKARPSPVIEAQKAVYGIVTATSASESLPQP